MKRIISLLHIRVVCYISEICEHDRKKIVGKIMNILEILLLKYKTSHFSLFYWKNYMISDAFSKIYSIKILLKTTLLNC